MAAENQAVLTNSDSLVRRSVDLADVHSFLPSGGKTLRVVDGPLVLQPLQPAHVASGGQIFKRILDIVGAIAIGLLFSPVILLAVCVIRSEGEPIIYKHRRIGRDGKAFDCLKFRTMVLNAEQVLKDLLRRHPELRDEWLRNHKLRNDPRITLIGRLLRKTSLDELPQLWNVIRGEMSLVGPRPVVKEELFRYGRNLSTYLAAKPGLTGLWQVKGRSNTSYRRRVAMDIYYVRNRSLLLDIYILALTANALFARAGAY